MTLRYHRRFVWGVLLSCMLAFGCDRSSKPGEGGVDVAKNTSSETTTSSNNHTASPASSTPYATSFPRNDMACTDENIGKASAWIDAWFDYRGYSALTAFSLATFPGERVIPMGVESFEGGIGTYVLDENLVSKRGSSEALALAGSEPMASRDFWRDVHERMREFESSPGPDGQAGVKGTVALAIHEDASLDKVGLLFDRLLATGARPHLKLFFLSPGSRPEGLEPVPQRVQKQLESLGWISPDDPFGEATRERLGKSGVVAYMKRQGAGCEALIKVYDSRRTHDGIRARAKDVVNAWQTCGCSFDLEFMLAKEVALNLRLTDQSYRAVSSVVLRPRSLAPLSFESSSPPTESSRRESYKNHDGFEDTPILMLGDWRETELSQRSWGDFFDEIRSKPGEHFCVETLAVEGGGDALVPYLYCSMPVEPSDVSSGNR